MYSVKVLEFGSAIESDEEQKKNLQVSKGFGKSSGFLNTVVL